MKINIIEDEKSFVIDRGDYLTKKRYENLVKYQRTFFRIIEDDEFLEKEVIRIRQKYNINIPNLPTNIKVPSHLKSLINFWSKDFGRCYDDDGYLKKGYDSIAVEIDILAKNYRMSYIGRFMFLSLIMYNFIFLYPELESIEVLTPEQVFNSQKSIIKNENDSFFIKVSQNTSLKKLINSIKLKKNQLNKLLKDNYCDFPKIRHIGAIEVYKKMFFLKTSGKTYSEIADNLTSVKAYSDSDVRVMIRRYKGLIRRLKSI